MSNYIVKAGESISDVVINSTGSLVNWDAICQANGFTDWTPILYAGQSIIIPSTVNIDSNSLQDAQAYPKCNSVRGDIYELIQDVWNTIFGNWILRTGFWNDGGVWIDTANWIDSL